MGMQYDPFLRVTAMSASAAKAFAMPDAVKTLCVGQADPARYKFGAREYLLFQTWADYEAYIRSVDHRPERDEPRSHGHRWRCRRW